MNVPKILLPLLVGLVGGIALVVACGDDSQQPVDAHAAVCDCPAAEPPITAARITIVEETGDVPAMGEVRLGTGCEAPSVLLSGGCIFDGTSATDVTLSENGPLGGGGWECEWKNPTNVAVPAIARAICLNP